jgi:hypothetical protein
MRMAMIVAAGWVGVSLLTSLVVGRLLAGLDGNRPRMARIGPSRPRLATVTPIAGARTDRAHTAEPAR